MAKSMEVLQEERVKAIYDKVKAETDKLIALPKEKLSSPKNLELFVEVRVIMQRLTSEIDPTHRPVDPTRWFAGIRGYKLPLAEKNKATIYEKVNELLYAVAEDNLNQHLKNNELACFNETEKQIIQQAKTLAELIQEITISDTRPKVPKDLETKTTKEAEVLVAQKAGHESDPPDAVPPVPPSPPSAPDTPEPSPKASPKYLGVCLEQESIGKKPRLKPKPSSKKYLLWGAVAVGVLGAVVATQSKGKAPKPS